MHVLAYHITWGTYGTRPHGDPRGTVDRQHNQVGAPVVGCDPFRWEQEKANCKYPPVIFTWPQRAIIETLVPQVCVRGHWEYQTCAAGRDHMHVILTSRFDPETIRTLLKRWIGQELRTRVPLSAERTCWSECGSIRRIETGRYFHAAVGYVDRQRALELVPA